MFVRAVGSISSEWFNFMAISYLPVSDHRFKKSPFFACNDREDTLYGIYNQRLYPISSGVNETEHYDNLRMNCCLYDVPETPLRISGDDSLAFLEKLFTRKIENIKVGRAGYAIACNHLGGVMMDGVLLRPSDEDFIYVQANGDFLNWARAHIGDMSVSIDDFDSWVLQIQGPKSLDLLEQVSDIRIEDFPYYACAETVINGVSFYVSRSGWTGERGFEIYSKNADFDGVSLWNHLLEKGAPYGIIPSDVSSMHVRRLEAGILDYGTDINDSINPFELGLGRLVHLDKVGFIGRDALEATNRKELRFMGLTCQRYPLVRGDRIFKSNGDIAGSLTAGAWSSHLGCGIGYARLNEPMEVGATILAQTDQGEAECKVVALPFVDPQKKLVK